MGRVEAKRMGTDFLAAIRMEAGFDNDREWEVYSAALDRDDGLTA